MTHTVKARMIEMVALPTDTESFLEGNGKKREDRHHQDRTLHTHNLQFCICQGSARTSGSLRAGARSQGRYHNWQGRGLISQGPIPQHPSKASKTGMVTRVKLESSSPGKLLVMKEGQCEAGKLIHRPESDPVMVTRVRYNHD